MDDNNKNKEIEKKISYSKLNLKTISIFQNDTQTIFIFKKTERLALAIYLLTNFLSDNEPVKWKMRDSVNRMLSYSINLSNQGHRVRAEAMNNYTATSFEIISLLQMADISGIFSSMNCEIVKFEIEKIIELVELKERSLNAKFLLSKNFFETSEGLLSDLNKREQTNQNFEIKDTEKNIDQNSNQKQNQEENRHKEQINIKDIKKEVKDISANKGHTIKDKDERYEVIINLLKKNKEIGVKDVSNIISDCSEKTLQRELLSLVEKGVLKKEGERRWSKYSLAS